MLMDLTGWHVHSLACGPGTFAVAADNSVITWGAATNGELGYGAIGKKSSANPAKVGGPPRRSYVVVLPVCLPGGAGGGGRGGWEANMMTPLMPSPQMMSGWKGKGGGVEGWGAGGHSTWAGRMGAPSSSSLGAKQGGAGKGAIGRTARRAGGRAGVSRVTCAWSPAGRAGRFFSCAAWR